MNIRLEKSRIPQHLLKYFETDLCSSCYVCHSIEIFREIRRVLRSDGVFFLNCGDNYASKAGGYSNNGSRGNSSVISANTQAAVVKGKRIARGSGRWGGGNNPPTGYLKEKDLCLIPFRVAIAAQEDDWWVRSVIVWSKNNPMPESVRDRPTESHEYILMLTKSAKYFFDQEAVREPHKPETLERYQYGYKESERDKLGHSHHGKGYQRNDGSPIKPNTGRNIRSVWTFPTTPFPWAHFAVFPEKLPETCIKAASSEAGCCSKCGAPWTRDVKKGFTEHEGKTKSSYPEGTTANRLAKLRQSAREQGMEYQNTNETISWHPTCQCNADKVPSIVLDPFAGSGTTGKVAKQLGRRCVMYELSEEYCRLALERNKQTGMVLT